MPAPVQTRYRISDVDVPIRSFPTLREIPYFLSHHKRRLRLIGNLVATVNRTHAHPTFMNVNAFHGHQTVYAAVDALAAPLAEFFERTEILPIVNPIFAKYEADFKDWDYNLASIFARRGILIPKEAR
jgi:hypothetical protein